MGVLTMDEAPDRRRHDGRDAKEHVLGSNASGSGRRGSARLPPPGTATQRRPHHDVGGRRAHAGCPQRLKTATAKTSAAIASQPDGNVIPAYGPCWALRPVDNY